MAIGSAIQKNKQVLVYDERGKLLFNKQVGSGQFDGLIGYTATTVTIRHGNVINTYNDKNHLVFNKQA